MGGFNAFQLADLEMDPYQHDCSLYKFSSENQKVEEAAWMNSNNRHFRQRRLAKSYGVFHINVENNDALT